MLLRTIYRELLIHEPLLRGSSVHPVQSSRADPVLPARKYTVDVDCIYRTSRLSMYARAIMLGRAVGLSYFGFRFLAHALRVVPRTAFPY